MKKLFYQLMAITLLLPLFQCERTEDEPKYPPVNQFDYEQISQNKEFTYAPELETYQVPVDEVRTKIRTYLNGENSRIDYTIQEAVWYIEALPNYFEGNASVNYKKMIITEHSYYFGSDANASVSSTQIDDFAATIQAQAIADKATAPCASNEKNTILVNVSPMTNSTGEVYLKATVGTGVQCYLPPNDEDPGPPYIEPDPCDLAPISWVTLGVGTCGNSNPINTTLNSAEVIENVVNSFDDNFSSCPMRYAFPTEDGFFSTITNSGLIWPGRFPELELQFYNPDDDIIGDNYRDYLLFQSWEPDPNDPTDHELIDCLDPIEMDFYLDGLYPVIYAYMGIKAPGKSFAMCNMEATLLPAGVPNRIHLLDITFGDYIP